MRFTVYLTVAVFLSLGAGASGGQEYAVGFTRPYRKKSVLAFTITASSTVELTRTTDGQAKQLAAEKIEAELQCQAKVLKADKAGNWRQLEITAGAVVYRRNGRARPFSALGKAILLSRSRNKVSFKRRDRLGLTKHDIVILKSFFGPVPKLSGDGTFGPGHKVTVGQEWTLDPLKLSRYFNLRQKMLRVTPANASGKFNLLRVKQEKDQSILQLSGRARFREITVTDPSFAGLKSEKAEAEMDFEAELPADPKRPLRASGYAFKASYRGSKTANRQKITLALLITERKRISIRTLKP